jgi:hypothetical protein
MLKKIIPKIGLTNVYGVLKAIKKLPNVVEKWLVMPEKIPKKSLVEVLLTKPIIFN